MTTTFPAPATATENHLDRRVACPSGAAAGADQLAARAGKVLTASADQQQAGRRDCPARAALPTPRPARHVTSHPGLTSHPKAHTHPQTCAPAFSFAFLQLRPYVAPSTVAGGAAGNVRAFRVGRDLLVDTASAARFFENCRVGA